MNASSGDREHPVDVHQRTHLEPRIAAFVVPRMIGAVAALLAACSSDEPPPPTPTGTFFSDSFEDGAPIPHGWDSSHGDMSIASGHLVARATDKNRGKEAAMRRALAPPAGAKSIKCLVAVNLARAQVDPKNKQTVVRVDVSGGSMLFDIEPDGWNVFGTFGKQEFGDGAKIDVHDRFATISILVANTGNVVWSLDNDAPHVHHVDIKDAPIDVTKAAIEVGVFSPPPATDVTAMFDDVVCSNE